MAAPDLTKRQAFVEAYVLSGNATDAARRAGVPASSASVMGHKWLRTPEVASAIRQAVERQLAELAPIAVNVVRQLLQDTQFPPSVRLAAARDLLDRARFLPPKRLDVGVGVMGKLGAELTRAELERLVSADGD